MEWRLLKLNKSNGAMQMAIDEAIVIANSKKKVPNTLRFYVFEPITITLGYNQRIDQFNLNKIKKNNWDYVRRISGGTAVLHKNDLTYSLIVSENDLPLKIIDAYKYLSQGLINGLKELKIPAKFKSEQTKKRLEACYLNSNPFDITVHGKKISGNAQSRINNTVLQHGTIIIKNNLKELFNCLNLNNDEINNLTKKAETKMTSIEKIKNQKPNIKTVEKAMIKGFEKLLNKKSIKLKKSKLTEFEINLAKKLYAKKYSTKHWNYIK